MSVGLRPVVHLSELLLGVTLGSPTVIQIASGLWGTPELDGVEADVEFGPPLYGYGT